MLRRSAVGLLAAIVIAAVAVIAPSSAASPPGVVRAAFYYPWFPETENWATRYSPTLGKYDSSNQTVLAAHVGQAKYAGLDAFISSWWGIGTKTDQRLPLLLDVAEAQQFSIAPYYEPASSATTPAKVQADFDSLAARSTHPGWLKVDGKPVLFVYNTVDVTCAAVTKFKTANAGRFYLNLKVFAGYAACADQPDSWHQYGPAVGYDQQGTRSASVSPGFFKFDEATPRLARDLTRFTSDLNRQVASGATWQLLTTFNEWGEGTSVEPATEWQSKSGMGNYLDAMRAVYLGLPSASPSPSPSSTPTPSVTPTPTPTPTPTSPPTVTKVLTFVEENHSLDQMKAGMPYLYSQAQQYGYASNYKAITHPSLPNYLALAGGSTFGVTDDAAPSTHPETGPQVFGAAIGAGKTAKSYQESMTANCLLTNSGRYAVKHNPWAYFTDDRINCGKYDVPSGTTTTGALHDDIVNGTLPNIGEVTPNLDNDAHDGTLATADNWLKNWLTLIYNSPDWQSGHLAVVVTADEDANNQGNLVLTTVIHPTVSHQIVTIPLTHYSWTRSMTRIAGAPCIRNGCTAADLLTAFGI